MVWRGPLVRTRRYGRNRTIYRVAPRGMFKSRYRYHSNPPRLRPRFKKPPVYVIYSRPSKAKRRLDFG